MKSASSYSNIVPTVWYILCSDSVVYFVFRQCDVFCLTVWYILFDSVVYFVFRQCGIFCLTVWYMLFDSVVYFVFRQCGIFCFHSNII
jgi:hypothetical protein